MPVEIEIREPCSTHVYREDWTAFIAQGDRTHATTNVASPPKRAMALPSDFEWSATTRSASQFGLIHGEEAAAWVAVSRRAVLRRMDEE